MAKKDSPKWNWRGAIDEEDFSKRCENVDFTTHSRSLGASSAQEISTVSAELKECLKTLYVNRTYAPPSRDAVKNALRTVAARAQALEECLDALDTMSALALDFRMSYLSEIEPDTSSGELGAPGTLPSDIELSNLRDSLSLLIDSAHLTIDTLPPKIHRLNRKSSALTEFVRATANVYESQTDASAFSGFGTDNSTGAYSGPFMEFVEQILFEFCPDWSYSNYAIGDTIRRALGRR